MQKNISQMLSAECAFGQCQSLMFLNGINDVGMVQLQHRSYGSIALYMHYFLILQSFLCCYCAHEN